MPPSELDLLIADMQASADHADAALSALDDLMEIERQMAEARKELISDLADIFGGQQ